MSRLYNKYGNTTNADYESYIKLKRKQAAERAAKASELKRRKEQYAKGIIQT